MADFPKSGERSGTKARKYTAEDIEIFKSNARKGTEIWEDEPHSVRVEQRQSGLHRWGFEGSSPNTRERSYGGNPERTKKAKHSSKVVSYKPGQYHPITEKEKEYGDVGEITRKRVTIRGQEFDRVEVVKINPHTHDKVFIVSLIRPGEKDTWEHTINYTSTPRGMKEARRELMEDTKGILKRREENLRREQQKSEEKKESRSPERSLGKLPSEKEKKEALEALGVVNGKDRSTLKESTFKEYFGGRGKTVIHVENGKLVLGGIEASHVSMIKEEMNTNLPDGYYKMEMNGRKEVSLKKIDKYESEEMPKGIQNPPFDYSNDSYQIRIDGKDLEKYLEALRHNTDPKHEFGDTVKFKMSQEGNKSYVTFLESKDDPEASYPKYVEVMKIEAVHRGEWGGRDPHVVLPREELSAMTSALIGNSRTKKPDNTLILDLKNEYPMKEYTRRVGPRDSHVEATGYIAPRMDY